MKLKRTTKCSKFLFIPTQKANTQQNQETSRASCFSQNLNIFSISLCNDTRYWIKQESIFVLQKKQKINMFLCAFRFEKLFKCSECRHQTIQFNIKQQLPVLSIYLSTMLSGAEQKSGYGFGVIQSHYNENLYDFSFHLIS